MYKKFLRTYALLGLIIVSGDAFGSGRNYWSEDRKRAQALGAEEGSFLEQVLPCLKDRCSILMCQLEPHRGKEAKKVTRHETERVQVEVGESRESRYTVHSGERLPDRVTTHYEWKTVPVTRVIELAPRERDYYQCSKCKVRSDMGVAPWAGCDHRKGRWPWGGAENQGRCSGRA